MPGLSRYKTPQKMQSASRRRIGDIGKVKDGGKYSLSKKSTERSSLNCYQKDSAMWGSIYNFPDQRFAIVIIELDEGFKILAPVMGSDLRSVNEMKMEQLESASSPEVRNALNASVEEAGHCPPDHISHEVSTKSESDDGSQSQKISCIIEENKNAISNSCSNRNHDISSDASGLVHDDAIVSTSADQAEGESKVCKPVKRSSRKKTKKKKGQIRKSLSCDSVVVTTNHSLSGTSVEARVEASADSSSGLVNDIRLDLNSSVTFSNIPHEAVMEMFGDEASGIDTPNLSATTSMTTSATDDFGFQGTESSLPQVSFSVDFVSERSNLGTPSSNQITEHCSSPPIPLTDSRSIVGVDLNSSLSFNDIPDEALMQMVGDEASGIDTTDIPASTSKATSSSFGLEFPGRESSLPHGSFSDDFEHERLNLCTPCSNQGTEVIVSGAEPLGTNQKQKNTGIEINSSHSSNEDISCDLDSYFDYQKTLQYLSKTDVIHPSESDALTDCVDSVASFDYAIFDNGSSNNIMVNRENHFCQLVDESPNASNRRKCDNLGFGWSDDFSSILGKEGSQDKIDLEGSNGSLEIIRDRNVHCCIDDTNYSVCKTFQKSDKDGCFELVDINPVGSNLDASDVHLSFARPDPCMGLNEVGYEKSIGSACLNEIWLHDDEHETSVTTSVDTFSLESDSDSFGNCVFEMEEPNLYSKMKHCQNFNEVSQADQASEVPILANDYESLGYDSENFICLPCNCNDLSSSKPFQHSQFCLEESRTLEDIALTASNMDSQALQNQTGSLPVVSNSVETLEVELEKNSKIPRDEDEPKDLCLEIFKGDGHLNQQILVSEAGKCSLGCDSKSLKFDCVGRKDIKTIGSFSESYLDDAISNSCGIVNLKGDHMSSRSKCDMLVVDAIETFLDPFSVEDVPRYDSPLSYNVKRNLYPECRGEEINELADHVFMKKTDSKKIFQTISDVYRTQIKSRIVELATGRPLAEFERLLHSTSPVLDQAYFVQCCSNYRSCLPIGDSLCRQQTPSICLKSLWLWYEIHGNYGLGVNTEVSHKKKFDSACNQFCAYFVPFLSAVQLFGHSRDCMGTFDVTSYDTFSASDQNQVNKQLVRGACLSDSELLFEYFESELPHKRRPLYEMIHELIRGNATSNSHIYGDPSKLESLYLHDLHPSSWYSVAWYPIFRIPDGNFRAAFLTYHSLGHFIRSASSDSLGEAASIAFPVIGLESSNAQGESWFEPRNFPMKQMERDLGFNPLDVLNERLRTLEHSAHLMARASLHKGESRLVNRHPDFEFFLSRRS